MNHRASALGALVAALCLCPDASLGAPQDAPAAPPAAPAAAPAPATPPAPSAAPAASAAPAPGTSTPPSGHRGPRPGPDGKIDGDAVLVDVDASQAEASDMVLTSVMRVFDPDGVKIRKLKIYQKGADKRVIRFSEPADVKGMAILTEGRDRIHVYLPAFQRVRPTAAHARNQSFLGSDFTYDDMGTVSLAPHYAARIVKEDAESYALELTPRPGEAGADIQWSRVACTVDRARRVLTRIEYYDDKGQKARTEQRTDWFQTKGGEGWHWSPRTIVMEDHRRNHKTEIENVEARINLGLKDADFTVRALMRGN